MDSLLEKLIGCSVVVFFVRLLASRFYSFSISKLFAFSVSEIIGCLASLGQGRCKIGANYKDSWKPPRLVSDCRLSKSTQLCLSNRCGVCMDRLVDVFGGIQRGKHRRN